MSGARLAAALVVIALLTFVVPPLAAKRVHQRRIAAAETDVARMARELAATTHAGGAARILHGPGEVPVSAPDVTWLAGVAEEPLPALGRPVGPDPWGNRYYAIVVGSGRGVVVLSAGPNGIVETGESPMLAGRGDDILAVR